MPVGLWHETEGNGSQLPDKYYKLGMDTLYNSAKLCRLAYGMKQKVMVNIGKIDELHLAHGLVRMLSEFTEIFDCIEHNVYWM